MMRLIALLTARYNWASDEVVIGQKEMASLWAVEERTAKRETRRLIEAKLLTIKPPGIRGRVAAYHFDRRVLYQQSAAEWGNVGPDYEGRMAKHQEPQPTREPVPEPIVSVATETVTPQDKDPKHPWTRTLARLAHDQPAIYQAWLQHLHADLPDREECLIVRAPTRFVASYVTSRLLPDLERIARGFYRQNLCCMVIAD